MNISLLLDMAADGFGDRVLLGRRTAGLTAARLRALSIGGARLIRSAGADSVVYLGVNGPAFPVALFAAARAGVPLVPVSYRLGGQQLGALLANHPRALGLAGPDETGALRAAGLTALTFGDWLRAAGPDQAGPDDPDRAEAEPQAPAVLIYTSGTTSAPKGVLRAAQQPARLRLRHGRVRQCRRDGGGPRQRAAVPHRGGRQRGHQPLRGPSHGGPRAVHPGRVGRARARAERVTNALVVPTMLARSSTPRGRRGGAVAAGPRLRRRADARAGDRAGTAPLAAGRLRQRLRPDRDQLDDRRARPRRPPGGAGQRRSRRAGPARVGRPAGARRSRWRSATTTATGLPPGASGRILVRGDQVSGEYAGQRLRGRRQRLVRHPRPGLPRRRRLPVHRGPGRRHDHPRRPRTSPPPRSRTCCSRTRRSPTRSWSASPTRSGASASRPSVVLRAGRDGGARPSCASTSADGCAARKTPDRIEFWTEIPRTETGKVVRRQALQRLISPTG